MFNLNFRGPYHPKLEEKEERGTKCGGFNTPVSNNGIVMVANQESVCEFQS